MSGAFAKFRSVAAIMALVGCVASIVVMSSSVKCDDKKSREIVCVFCNGSDVVMLSTASGERAMVTFLSPENEDSLSSRWQVAIPKTADNDDEEIVSAQGAFLARERIVLVVKVKVADEKAHGWKWLMYDRTSNVWSSGLIRHNRLGQCIGVDSIQGDGMISFFRTSDETGAPYVAEYENDCISVSSPKVDTGRWRERM